VCDIREGLKLVMENDLEPVVAGVWLCYCSEYSQQ
jgi:hypothetical protein